MEQRAITIETVKTTQTAQATETQNQQQASIKYRWMRLFFTEDIFPDNHRLIDLQRRACWIGIALMLQGLNELSHVDFIPHPQPYESLISFLLLAGSLWAIWMALRPDRLKPHSVQRQPRRWQQHALLLIIVEAVIGSFLFGYIIGMCFLDR